MSFRGKVLGTAFSASVIAGCGSMPDISMETLRPAAPNPNIDTCATNNPDYGPYDPTRPAAKLLGVSVSHDTRNEPPLLSTEKIEILKRNLEALYGLEIVYPENATSKDIYHYKSAITGTEKDQQVKSTTLQYATEALSLYPTELVRDSDPKQLVFTPSLTDHSQPKTINLSGTYDIDDRTIIVSYGQQEKVATNVAETIFHETLHGIEVRVMCGVTDHEVDADFAGVTQYFHGSGEQENVDQSIFKATPDREFYDHHAADNVMEDRVAAGTSLVYGRGRIQDGDPDHGSVFDDKQGNYLVRLNNMMPGFDQMVEERAEYLRDESTNELNLANN